MDPSYPFSANLYKWEPRPSFTPGTTSNRLLEMIATPIQQPQQSNNSLLPSSTVPPPTTLPCTTNIPPFPLRPPQAPPNLISNHQILGGLEDLFQAYGIRYYTAAKIAELGFTVNTLLDMKDEELNDMMNSLCQIFRWELLVGERYGIKAAIRAEKRRVEDLQVEEARRRHHHQQMFNSGAGGPVGDGNHTSVDAFSQEGLSDEVHHVQQADQMIKDHHHHVALGSGGDTGGGGTWEMVAAANERKKYKQRIKKGSRYNNSMGDQDDDGEDDDDEYMDQQDDGLLLVGGGCGGGGTSSSGGGVERQREHPFIVTEPGEVARGKKNGLDYLFHLYELCREFLIQVQNIAKERGEKCPTKVTNQVFRYAKKAGATYINKPKMRHYVHCYALHCLDEETSNVLRRAFKERRENVGAWRQACYKPLVNIAASQGWDIDAIFNAHPRLSIWYVPTKLRQLCHAERSSVAAAASSSVSGGGGGVDHLGF